MDLRLFFYSLVFAMCFSHSEAQNTTRIFKLLKKDRQTEAVLSSKIYDIQIIYTHIDRKNNKLKFEDYYFNVDKNYFYPSTTVFLPAAVLTLEKINGIAKECDVDKFRDVRFDDVNDYRPTSYLDTSNNTNFAEILKRMLCFNDKNAFNNCYDFLNQRYFNERFHDLGYPDSWFLHKLNDSPPEDSKQSNIVTFFKTNVQSHFIDLIFLKRHITVIPFLSVYVKKAELNPIDYYSDKTDLFLGTAQIRNDSLLNGPVNFAKMNKYTITDMHEFLKSLIFPETQIKKPNLTDEDYNLLYTYMSDISQGNSAKYIFGDKVANPSFKIFNNSGKDLGFMLDNAYVIDKTNGVDFFLTIMIKCNKNNIFGEQYYEYEQIGLPFIRKAANLIYEYELEKKKTAVNFDSFLNKLKPI